MRESLSGKLIGAMKVKVSSRDSYAICCVAARQSSIAPSRLLAVGRRMSVCAGTRKMVNYA